MIAEEEDDNLVYPDDEEEREPREGPFRDGKVWVLTRKCDTCVYRPGNLMHLRPGRLKQITDQCIRENRTLSCHETYDGPQAICRGFYDTCYKDSPLLQMADRLGVLAFMDPPAKESDQ